MSLTGRATSPAPPSERKPYSPPRITCYGHIKDIVKGTGGGGSERVYERTTSHDGPNDKKERSVKRKTVTDKSGNVVEDQIDSTSK